MAVTIDCKNEIKHKRAFKCGIASPYIPLIRDFHGPVKFKYL